MSGRGREELRIERNGEASISAFSGILKRLSVHTTRFRARLSARFHPSAARARAADFVAGAYVGLPTLVGMRLRRVPPATVITARTSAVKAGLAIPLNDLEAHFLARKLDVPTHDEAHTRSRPGPVGRGDHVPSRV